MCIILYAYVSAQMPGLPEAVVTSRGHLPLLNPLSVSRGHWPSNHEGQCLTSPKALHLQLRQVSASLVHTAAMPSQDRYFINIP